MRKVLSIGIAVSSAAAGLSASLVSQAAPITSNWVDRTDSWSCGNCVTQWKNSDGSNRFPNNGADTFSVNLGPGSGAQPQSVIQLDQNITIDNFSQTGNTLAPAAGVKRPTLTINNLFSWTAGTISGNLQVIANGPPLGKSLSIDGTPLLNGATLINRGDATMSGGGLIGNTRAVGNSRTQVFNTGTFSITDNSILDVLGKATNVEPLFENRGIFRKTGGAAGGQSSIGWDFINNGAVQVQTGTLTIGATGKYSQPMGSLTVDKGTIFRSTKDLTIGGSIGGEGTIQAPNVKNNAIIDPNQKGAAGELNINGNLALSSRPTCR